MLIGCSGRPVSRADRALISVDTSALVAQLAGCYELRTINNEYLVLLQTKRTIGEWDARLVDRNNSPGNSWSWNPTDSAHFVVRWGGIDGALI